MFNFCDNKRGRILKSGLTVFLTYGFKKTSMDDIAREADMSRPALYLVFRNKSDIFRALSGRMMENAALFAKEAFKKDGPFHERLIDCIEQSIMKVHRFVDENPHGLELMGVNQEVAQDLELEWKAQMVTVITEGIEQGIARGEVDLSRFSDAGIDANAVATIIMQGMEGLRMTYLTGKPIEPFVEKLINFVALSISAPPLDQG